MGFELDFYRWDTLRHQTNSSSELSAFTTPLSLPVINIHIEREYKYKENNYFNNNQVTKKLVNI